MWELPIISVGAVRPNLQQAPFKMTQIHRTRHAMICKYIEIPIQSYSHGIITLSFEWVLRVFNWLLSRSGGTCDRGNGETQDLNINRLSGSMKFRCSLPITFAFQTLHKKTSLFCDVKTTTTCNFTFSFTILFLFLLSLLSAASPYIPHRALFIQ